MESPTNFGIAVLLAAGLLLFTVIACGDTRASHTGQRNGLT